MALPGPGLVAHPRLRWGLQGREGPGGAMKKRDEVHRMAGANKAFSLVGCGDMSLPTRLIASADVPVAASASTPAAGPKRAAAPDAGMRARGSARPVGTGIPGASHDAVPCSPIIG